MIKIITKTYTRTYSDSGQITTYIEFLDENGKSGRLEGNIGNTHIDNVLARAKREGIVLTNETW